MRPKSIKDLLAVFAMSMVGMGEAGAFSIRAAAPEDADLLLPLHSVLHHVHVSARPDAFHDTGAPAERKVHIEALLRRPDWFALLAEDAIGAAGYVLGETQRIGADALQCARCRGFVHHIAVRPGARRRGVGSALLAAARTRFLAEGASVWATTYWAWNEASAGLMAKAGLSPAIILADAQLR